MDRKVLEEKDINQEYVIYFYNIAGFLTKKCFENEDELKEFITNNKDYKLIDNIYINGRESYFRMQTTIELITK